MFNIIGDEITYDGHTVAFLGLRTSTLRDQVETALECVQTDDEQQEALNAAEDEGRSDGRTTQWEICFDAVDAFMTDAAGGVEFSSKQREAVLTMLKELEPK